MLILPNPGILSQGERVERVSSSLPGPSQIYVLVSGEQKHYFHSEGLQKPLVAFATCVSIPTRENNVFLLSFHCSANANSPATPCEKGNSFLRLDEESLCLPTLTESGDCKKILTRANEVSK
jgi:hypothetical protein